MPTTSIDHDAPVVFSFAAAGWLQLYLFGAGHAIAEHMPGACCESLNLGSAAPSPLAAPMTADGIAASPQELRFIGSSAGAIAAVSVVTGASMEALAEYAASCAMHCRQKWYRAFMLREYVRGGVEMFISRRTTLFQDPKEKRAESPVLRAASPHRPLSSTPSVESLLLGDDDEEEQDDAEERPLEEIEGENAVEAALQRQLDASATVVQSPNTTSATVLPAVPVLSPCEGQLITEDSPTKKPSLRLFASGSTSLSAPTSFLNAFRDTEDVADVDVAEAEVAATLCAVAGRRSHKRAGVSRRQPRQFCDELRTELRRRLEIYATSLPFLRPVVFTDFYEVADVEEALVASCCITPLAGLPFRTRRTGEWVCDGGAVAFQPRAGQRNVITISALYFTGADICPSEFVPAWWGLYPPGDAEYRDLFDMGYNDAVRHLVQRNMIPKSAEASLRKRTQKPRERRALGLLADTAVAAFFCLVLRPLTMLLVYAELMLVTATCLWASVFHTWFPAIFELLISSRSHRRHEGGRLGALKDAATLMRNMLSARVWLHLAFGRRIGAHATNVERYSRVYRFLKPMVG